MKERYVVDTNILAGANAGNPMETRKLDVTPKDPKLRKQIWEWLVSLQRSGSRIVVDIQGKIRTEYKTYILPGSYSEQFMIAMNTSGRVDQVWIQYDAHGYAILADTLECVHDKSDKKIIASCLKAIEDYGSCIIAFAGDSDWHYWEDELIAHGVELEAIIEEWSRAKYKEKSGNK